MEDYYSPGLHIVYADAAGNIGYQTLVHAPLTRRTSRLAMEGWTGEDEVLGRVPLAEMPHMFNPDAHFISHANNLPIGSWYPIDLGLATGGIGDTTRSMRLRQLLSGTRKLSLDDFEAMVHRDDVNAAVAALWPVARRVALEEKVDDPAVRSLMDGLKDWNTHYRSADRAYAPAMALADNFLLSFRMSGLRDKVGGGEGGICHLARLLAERYGKGEETPKDPDVRGYLVNWLRAAAGVGGRPGARSATAGQKNLAVQAMSYQGNGPLGFPSMDAKLDIESPLLSCTQIGTIWSQAGNSYSQIVDLGDVDNSRSVLPPGVSEDPASPYYTNQMALWVKGTTHPAPLSRKKIEAVSRQVLTAVPYAGPMASKEKLARTENEGGGRFVPAIPQTVTAQNQTAPEELPGRKPDDPQLEAAVRYLIRPDRTVDEVDAKIVELRDYVKGDVKLRTQLVSGLRLVLYLKYGTEEARQKMAGFLKELGGELPPERVVPKRGEK